MNKHVIIHNLPSDIPGKTWKEKNMEIPHKLPIGSLVEIKDTGARLFVVKHTRDCDGTPLYILHPDIEEYEDWKDNQCYYKSFGGYSEDYLKLIEDKTDEKE